MSKVDFRSQQLPRILATGRVRPSSLCHAAQARLLLDDESPGDSLGGSLCGSLGLAADNRDDTTRKAFARQVGLKMFQLEITILAWAALLAAAGANSNQLKACLKLLNDFSIGPWPWPSK